MAEAEGLGVGQWIWCQVFRRVLSFLFLFSTTPLVPFLLVNSASHSVFVDLLSFYPIFSDFKGFFQLDHIGVLDRAKY